MVEVFELHVLCWALLGEQVVIEPASVLQGVFSCGEFQLDALPPHVPSLGDLSRLFGRLFAHVFLRHQLALVVVGSASH